MIVYYNPECSKCSVAKEILEHARCEFTLREYLKDPPTIQELEDLLHKLNCKAFEIVRTSEPLYKSTFSDRSYTDAEWLEILSSNPVLIERPIVIEDDRALIGRPPSLILDLIGDKK